jgi:Flp pilus assembly protein CpaB
MVLAATQGTVQFVLRNGADQNSPETKPVAMSELMGTNKPVVVEKEKRIVVVKAAPVPETKPAVFHEVETISGGKKSVDKFE